MKTRKFFLKLIASIESFQLAMAFKADYIVFVICTQYDVPIIYFRNGIAACYPKQSAVIVC